MGEYVCTLDKASVEKAAKELNENPKEREAAVEALRQWVLQNSSWLTSPTDTKFLLAFLRNAKFVQLAARKRLVKFWTARSKSPLWFSNVDTHDERFAACIRMGVFVFLPKRDKDGRFFYLGRTGAMDVSGKYKLDEMMRAWTALIDYSLLDENLQVNGIVTIEDMSNLTMKHQTFMKTDDMRRMMDTFIKGYPVRYKALHYYNVNPIFEAMFALISPLLPEKLKKRVQFHGKNLADVYKCLDKTCLPSDYLPDDIKGETISCTQDCIEDNLKALQSPEVRDYILWLTGSGFGVNLALKPSDDELFTESFRKLNVY